MDGKAGAIRRAAEVAADEQERRGGIRVLALGRLVAVPAVAITALMADDELAGAFWPFFVVAALFELAFAAVGASRHWARLPIAATAVVDLAALCVLLSLSGGAMSDLRHLVLLFPAAVAFAFRPWATGLAAGLAGLAYLLAASGDLGTLQADSAALRFFVGLLWIGGIATLLSAARQDIAQRTQRLLAARGELLSAVLDGESRRRRETSSALHEDALQHLLAARQDLLEVDADEAARARRALDLGIEVLREAVNDLHPVALGHGGLQAALRALAEREARTGGFSVAVDVDPAAAGQRDDVLVDVAREVLANVRLHARACELCVWVGTTADGVSLRVEDDGVGFDPEALDSDRRVGLPACRERVEALGGAFVVRSAPGHGTTIFAAVPAPEAVAAAPVALRPPAPATSPPALA